MDLFEGEDKPIMEIAHDGSWIEILGHRIDGFESFEAFRDYLIKCAELEDKNKLLKHRLDMANEYIDSRKENMIVDHYDDLKYILNECDLESSW